MSRKNQLFFIAKKCSNLLQFIIPYNIRSAIKERMVEKSIHSFLKTKEEFHPQEFLPGVNLIGSIRAEMGLGQSCRLVANELKQSEFSFSIFNVNFDGELREKDHSFDEFVSDQFPYQVNLFHVNPCELSKVFMRMPDTWNKHYNIAFWLWELEEFPKEWIKYCALFDEIWTPSEFAGRGIKRVTDVPVRTVPYSVSAPYDEHYSRDSFSLPEDKFLYLIMYDSNSTSGRKNPQGALRAYKTAFPREETDSGIVIKINNAKDSDIAALKKELHGYQNVYFITEILEKEQVNSLIKCVDVFISLHRAEGFGLVMAEAMLLGTPVVATNWSSNTEFMSEDSACMVKYKLVKNEKTEGLYKKGCVWAEADIEDAAEYIKRLKNDCHLYETKAINGKECIHSVLNDESTLELWRSNLYRIIKER